MPMHNQQYVSPPPVHMCRTCGKKLADTLIEQGIEYHVGPCDPSVVMDQRSAVLKQQIIEVVEWVDEHSQRSQQVEIGPSEMGNPCDQRIGRSMAGMPRVNFRIDPWPAIVGTAVHKWLEKAIATFQRDFPAGTPVRRWQTEMDIRLDDLLYGHSDLYTHDFDVVDHKTAGVDVFAKIKKNGLLPYQKVQGHLYGYGHEQAGRPVRDIVFIYYPRAGWLKDLILFREPYDRTIAEAAIERVYSIGHQVLSIGALENPERWNQIPTAPGDHCYSCPFFVDRPAEQLPDGTGCPGYSGTAEERKEKSKASFVKGLL